MYILNIISSTSGGGAELIVRKLHSFYLENGKNSHVIYFSGPSIDTGRNETILSVNPRSPLNIFRIRKILKRIQQDQSCGLIVHIHLTWPFYYAALGSFGLKNIKLFYTEHNTTNKRRSFPLLWVLERFLYARFDRIICISQGVRDALADWIGSALSQRLTVIPNGARIYSFVERPMLQGRLPRFVSIGSLSKKKNFATAINAIARIQEEVESYIIIGEGPERDRLQKIIQDNNLEKKVALLGWSDDLESYLHASDIQLIPSLWEGFGLVAVEGMSTGLPVVASNVDGLREVLDENSQSATLVDDPLSCDEWIVAIRSAINDIHVTGFYGLGIESRKQAEKFTLAKMARRYLEAYENVLLNK